MPVHALSTAESAKRTGVSPPLLRPPPFPGPPVLLHRSDHAASGDCASTLHRLRSARVGGAFWDPPPPPAWAGGMVVRAGTTIARDRIAEAIGSASSSATLWVGSADAAAAMDRSALCLDRADPWTTLERASMLVAHGDDEWAAIAHLLGVPVRFLSPGRFGGTDMDDDKAKEDGLLGALTATGYTNPFTGEAASLTDTIDLLADWRQIIDANRSISVACGMAWWKRDEIRRFLWSPDRNLRFVARGTAALEHAASDGGAIAAWPSRVSPQLLADARTRGIGIVRVEDGFVRSVGLGSDLVPPLSIVVDARGIHFDPSRPSDLEHILAHGEFGAALTARAHGLRQMIVRAGISKYAASDASPPPPRASGRRLVLVPAQVEDDMSVLAGGGGITSNLELLRRVRALEPDAEIWFRPHPDVDAGHRKGAVPDADALRHADHIVRGGSMAALLDVVDAVHVLTSLTGFEALLRHRDVTCHGTPFYAGWGLTRDLAPVPDRRGRALTLDELVAGVLILYPRYLDPVTRLPCPPEILIRRMTEAAVPNRLSRITRLRQWQGRLMARWR